MRIMSVALCLSVGLTFAPTSRCEDALPVSVCDLIANPAAYEHKLIEVTGQVAYGFENFTLSSKDCDKPHPDIWIDYGGTLKSGAIPEGRKRRREHPLTIEGITTQLIEDSSFDSFDALIHKPLHDRTENSLKATLVGRYFAGKPGAMGVREWRGFGMWGLYSLFVIQQVISTES
jgi:hypothetical protein